jgi:hypothetical protein
MSQKSQAHLTSYIGPICSLVAASGRDIAFNNSPSASSSPHNSTVSLTTTTPAASTSSLPIQIRRSASIPYILDFVSAETVTISSPGDKRRNKLGYQRTSMACGKTHLRNSKTLTDHVANIRKGHCRRRKIRCIPPVTEDPQGRCANCIRLKKECVFFPVDHQTDARPGRRDVGSISASSASSPQTPIPTGPMSIKESQADSPYDHSAPIPIHGASSSLSPAYMQDAMAPVPSPLPPGFDYAQAGESSQWTSTEYSGQAPLHSPYWASAESTPSRQSFSQNQIPVLESAQNHNFAGSHMEYAQETQQWPNRSASFSHFGDPSHSYTYPEAQQTQGINPAGLQYQMSNQHNPLGGASLTPEPSSHSAGHLSPPGHVLPSNVPFQQQQWPHQGGPHDGEGQQWYGHQPQSTAPDPNDPAQGSYANVQHHHFYTTTSHPG